MDQKEAEIVHRTGDPTHNLMWSMQVSERVGVLVVDGEIIAMGGIGWGKDVTSCQPWFVGTDSVADHPVTILRYSRFFIEHLKKEYDLMENWVLRENQAARDLIEVLGFEFDGYEAEYPHGFMDHFIWRRAA
jgi:hypothetical protein